MLKLDPNNLMKLTCRSTSSGWEISDGRFVIAQGLSEEQAVCMTAGPRLLHFVSLFKVNSPIARDLAVVLRNCGVEFDAQPR